MKQALFALSLVVLTGSAAFANSTKGAASCNLGIEAAALVNWDYSPGEGFANFNLFTPDSNGKFQSYSGAVIGDADSLDFPSDYGGNYTVKVNRLDGTCSIAKKATR